jgi:hypothetical protein
VARLGELAARAEPETPELAREWLEDLAAWLHAGAGEAFVERKRPAVRGRARGLLETEVTLRGAHTLSGAKVELLAGQRVRLTYEFEHERELLDFEPGHYPAAARKGLPPLGSASMPFVLESGGARAVGEASLRTLYELGAPLTLRWAFGFDDGGSRDGNDTLGVGCCDDGKESFLWVLNRAFLELHASQRRERDMGADNLLYLGASYALELVHDGQRATLASEGLAGPSMAAPELQAGAVFLFVHANNPARCERLVLEGQRLPGSFARLAAAWIERELAGF